MASITFIKLNIIIIVGIRKAKLSEKDQDQLTPRITEAVKRVTKDDYRMDQACNVVF